jgi:Acetoacetate decarboxylase (ADC)
MSTFLPSQFPELDPMFRMPVDFGPLPGPRNLPREYDDVRSYGRMLHLTVQARSDRAALQAILPPTVNVPEDPLINFSLLKLTNLGWLAGRGYNIIIVTLPVLLDRGDGAEAWDYMPVLWEGHPDPVITGRAELGHPKLAATVPDPMFLRDTVRGHAHWEGFRFCEFEIANLRADDRAPAAPKPLLTRKYVPRTGEWGVAELDQLTGPLPDPDAVPGAPPVIHRRDRGEGTFRFFPARWEDMPTQYPVVCRLAELPLLEFTDASVMELEGSPGNGRVQGIIADLTKVATA